MFIRQLFICCLFLLPMMAYAQLSEKLDIEPSILLRSDGLYSTYDTSPMPHGGTVNTHYAIYSPLYVINSTNAVYLNGLGGGKILRSLDYFQNLKYYKSKLGTISIEKTKIKACLPIDLYVGGMRLKIFTAYFEGDIKNRDTIINWHMVPPYPKAPKKFNDNFKNLINARSLYFEKGMQLLGLDSLLKQRLSDNSK